MRQRLRLNKAPSRSIEVEQLRIPSPVDRGLHLAQRLLFAELLVEHVVKELLRNAPVALGLDRAHDLAQQQHILYGRCSEQLFLPQESRSSHTPLRSR